MHAKAHGHCIGVFLQDEERTSHGANACIEIIARACQSIIDSGSQLPAHLCIQTDNTVALSKNGATHIFTSALVGMKKFATVTVNYLIKGHTHEDVDRFMGELLPIMRRHKWEDIDQLVSVLDSGLQARATHVKEKVVVQHVQAVRDWESYLEPLNVHLSNTFRSRKDRNAQPGQVERSTAHSFSYKRFADLSSVERSKISKIRGRSHHPDDVYAIVKTRMHHDASEAHDPVCTMWAERLESLNDASGLQCVPQCDLNEKRQAELKQLAKKLDEYKYHTGAHALRRLVQQTDEDLVVPNITWLDGMGTAQMPSLVTTGNRYYAHLPEISWPLLASFK